VQIILVSNRLSRAKSITLSPRHVMLAGLLVFAMVLAIGAGLSYSALRVVPTLGIPGVAELVGQITEREQRTQEAFVRDNINALAVKLGEMQAHLMRLDALGERLVGLTGGKAGRDLKFGETPGRGGAASTQQVARQLSVTDLQVELEALTVKLDYRGESLRIIEDQMLRDRARKTLLPSANPVDAPYPTSHFGWRIDPFNGKSTHHEGIDFAAPVGTPILAAAGGVVITADRKPNYLAYGLMIEIDHGNGLMTRYAHASKLHVKPGEVVRRGQHIADVGATGQATGPHLHFEVRQNEVAQNPLKFIGTLASR